MKNLILFVGIWLPCILNGQHSIVIDGDFDDWADVPISVTDPADDVHDTDGDYPEGGQPEYRKYDDVDLLEVKFTNDGENLYGYMKATGEIGRTSSDTLGHSKIGRYYFIFTIDVDNNDTTGYRLKNGGYYPDSKGYDMNMEVEFYNGGFNTGHYINHEFLTKNQMETQGIQDLEDGFVRLAPGTYDWYTQWVTFDDSSYVLVSDKGPVYQGIITIAVSEDGHEAEIKAPMWGFLKTPQGEPIVSIGKTMVISASLEASGELADGGDGSSSSWGSDTAEKFLYTVKDAATAIKAAPTSQIPETAYLYQNYPNPFNPATTIAYKLNKNSFVLLEVFNILGEKVTTLVNKNQSPGFYRVKWNAVNKNGLPLPSGVYFVKLTNSIESKTRQMVLIR